MSNYIKRSNLPEGRVSKAICGRIPRVFVEHLKERNIDIIFSDDNPYIDFSVRNHADMSAVHLGENRVAVDRGQISLIEKLTAYGFETILTDRSVKGEYPDDVSLNIALFGDNAVGNFKFADTNLLNEIDGFRKFSIKQGYAKCSILPVTESAIITDDPSVCNALKNIFETLFISKGDICLNGHEYGFIGGAAARISKDEIFFFGDIEMHRDYIKIADFLNKHNFVCSGIKNVPLTDIGGIVTLCEY